MTTPWIVAFAVQWVLVLLLGLLVIGTFRRLTPLLERSEEVIASAARRIVIGGLAPGAVVSDFSTEIVGGAAFQHDDLLGSTSVVLFLGSECQACERLIDDLVQDRVPALEARIFVVSSDPVEAQRLARSQGVQVVVDERRELSRVFESAVTPQAFVVDGHGVVVRSGTPNEWEELRSLLEPTEGGDRQPEIAAVALAP